MVADETPCGERYPLNSLVVNQFTYIVKPPRASLPQQQLLADMTVKEF